MTVIPSSLALTPIADGSPIVAADHRNNYAAIQAAVNAIEALLGAGTTGQTLISGGASAVTWGNADRGQYGMSAAQSVPSGVLTALNTNWANNVSVGGVSMSAGIVTVANAGVYLATVNTQFVANAAGVFETQWVATNLASGGIGGLVAVPNSAALSNPAINMSLIIFFNAGGTLGVQAAQTSGANMNVQALNFNIHRLS